MSRRTIKRRVPKIEEQIAIEEKTEKDKRWQMIATIGLVGLLGLMTTATVVLRIMN